MSIRHSATLIITTFIIMLSCLESFGEYRATASLDSAKLLMGETMKLQIEVEMPSDKEGNVSIPILNRGRGKSYVGILNDTIELSTKYTVDTIAKNNIKYLSYNLSIQAFDSGRYELPPFEVQIDKEIIKTNALALEVLPVKVTAEDKIDDFSSVVEPFDIAPEDVIERSKENNSWIIWLIIGCIAALAVLLYLYFNYKKTGSIIPKRKPLEPYQVALKQLEKLKNQNLLQKGKIKEYYTRLTDIIRRYLYRQFYIKSIEQTSNEIISEMRKNPDLSKYADAIGGLLGTADFVKFAKVIPADSTNDQYFELAKKFVLASRPVTEEKENKEGGKK